MGSAGPCVSMAAWTRPPSGRHLEDDDTGAQLLFRFVAAAYERRALGVASHQPFELWGRFVPEHTTAASLLDRLLHLGGARTSPS